MDLSAIQRRIAMIEKYSKEIRDAKEILKDELENEPTYVEAAEEAKAASNKKKQLKDEILGRGPNQKLQEEIKSNAEELATLRDILSAELTAVFRENDSEEITDENGENRKFKVVAKLLPKGSKSQDRDDYGKYKDAGE